MPGLRLFLFSIVVHLMGLQYVLGNEEKALTRRGFLLLAGQTAIAVTVAPKTVPIKLDKASSTAASKIFVMSFTPPPPGKSYLQDALNNPGTLLPPIGHIPDILRPKLLAANPHWRNTLLQEGGLFLPQTHWKVSKVSSIHGQMVGALSRHLGFRNFVVLKQLVPSAQNKMEQKEIDAAIGNKANSCKTALSAPLPSAENDESLLVIDTGGNS